MYNEQTTSRGAIPRNVYPIPNTKPISTIHNNEIRPPNSHKRNNNKCNERKNIYRETNRKGDVMTKKKKLELLYCYCDKKNILKTKHREYYEGHDCYCYSFPKDKVKPKEYEREYERVWIQKVFE